MASTMQPEQKLAVAVGISPVKSSTGLMMTPPPAPTTEPMVEAEKQIESSNITVPARVFLLSVHSQWLPAL